MVIESDKSYVDNSISQLTDQDSDSDINYNLSIESNKNNMYNGNNNNDSDKAFEHTLSNVEASPALSTRSKLLLKDEQRKAAPISPPRQTDSSNKKLSSKSGSLQKSKQAISQQPLSSASKTVFLPKKKEIAANNPLYAVNEVLANKIPTFDLSDNANDANYMSTLLKSVSAAKNTT
jgi:hypothetical protein